jgi:hypothetical protein
MKQRRPALSTPAVNLKGVMKLMSSIAQPTTPRNSGERTINQLRDYLGRLEAIARHGRLAEAPNEVKAAVWCFARPSTVLRRLAEKDRRLA